MKMALLSRLCCPETGRSLEIEEEDQQGDEITRGRLVTEGGGRSYPIENCIPRFVSMENYAATFGLQWNRFSKTQLDSSSGHPISANRFWDATGWSPDEIAGKWVLDVGCGAGRFAEVALRAGAFVVALDYSSAVDACYRNLAPHPNLCIIQGDIYALPFPVESFDFVYSLGVLQHTPDVKKAFFALPPMVRPGGKLCVDFYEKSWKSVFLPKYWLRPITKRIEREKLFDYTAYMVPKLLPVSDALGRVPFAGRHLKRIVPVANSFDGLPLTARQRYEWALLDTFDWLAPAHDHPQTAATVERWLSEAGMVDRQVLKAGHLVGRGAAPAARETAGG